MTTQPSSDSRLTLLRASAEWDKKHGDAVVLHPDIALALVECAEALKDMRARVCGMHQSCGHDFSCICAGMRMDAALAKLEAL